MRTIILDPAHGFETPGKRSPDGTHREYLWSRIRLENISMRLEANGVNVVWSNVGDNEIGVNIRRQNMNRVLSPAFVFSLHNNAASLSGWNNARGAEIYTTIGQTESDEFATKIYEKLKNNIPEVNWRTDYYRDGDPDKEANFAVLMSKHPSVLLEWLFMDNKEDLELIKNDEINERLETSLVEILSEIAGAKAENNINEIDELKKEIKRLEDVKKVLASKVKNLQKENAALRKTLKLNS